MNTCLLTPSGLKCGPGSLQSLLLWMWKPCLPSLSPTTSDTVKFKSPSGSVCCKSIFPLIVPESIFSSQWVIHPSWTYRLFICLLIKTINTLPSTPSIAENSQYAVSGLIVSIIFFTSEAVAEMQLKHKASIKIIIVIHIVKLLLVRHWITKWMIEIKLTFSFA